MDAGKKTTCNRLRLKHKFWLEKNGAVFGDGLFDLLTNIDDSGSIARAAGAMVMSYRAAWGKIKNIEKRWGISLVETRAGGKEGGGTSLTAEAKELLKRYGRLKEEAGYLLKSKFGEVFLE